MGLPNARSRRYHSSTKLKQTKANVSGSNRHLRAFVMRSAL